jgi:hypothetical protein
MTARRLGTPMLVGALAALIVAGGDRPALAYVIENTTWAYQLPDAMGEKLTVCRTGMTAAAVARTKEAAALWNYEHFTFGFTADTRPAQCPGTSGRVFDGVNQISFGGDLGQFTLAVTTRFFFAGTHDTLECDMRFADTFAWYTGTALPVPIGTQDWLSVAAHEMGHCVGVDHEDDDDISPDPVMRTSISDGVRRLPTNNDLAGRNAIYGDPTGGTPAHLDAQPVAGAFGNVAVGQFVERTFTLRNRGLADLHVASIRLTGAGAGEFVIVLGGPGPVTLQADQAHAVVLALQPAGAGGPRTATLEVVSDDPEAPEVLIPLSGTAIDPIRDMAVTRVVAPRRAIAGRTRPVTVEIQNRGAVPVAFTDAHLLGGLVALDVTATDPGDEGCAPAAPVALDAARNAALFRRGPKVLAPKQKAAIRFLVTYACTGAARVASGPDYRHVARVFQGVLIGTDVHPADDVCPHPAVLGGIDPNPDGTVRDRGCGAPRRDGSLGGDVTTDVVAR